MFLEGRVTASKKLWKLLFYRHNPFSSQNGIVDAMKSRNVPLLHAVRREPIQRRYR